MKTLASARNCDTREVEDLEFKVMLFWATPGFGGGGGGTARGWAEKEEASLLNSHPFMPLLSKKIAVDT